MSENNDHNNNPKDTIDPLPDNGKPFTFGSWLAKYYKELLTVFSILSTIGGYVYTTRSDNVELRKHLDDVHVRYNKNLAKIKLDYEAKLRVIQTMHIKQLRLEDKEHEREISMMYQEINRLENKVERVKLERDLLTNSEKIPLDKNDDPISRLDRARKKNAEKARKSFEYYKKIRDEKKKYHKKMDDELSQIDEKEHQIEKEYELKVPTE